MALSHVSKVYAVDDCKVAKLTADPDGGSPTYATIIDVPGIKSVEIGGTVDTKSLRGDNQLLDTNSKLQNVTLTVAHAKISLDVYALMVGGTVTDSGTTPNQKVTYDLLGTDSFNYWKLEARTPAGGADQIAGDIHFILHKCMLSALPSDGHAEEDYKIVSFTAECSPLISTKKWKSTVINETAAAIA